VTNAVNVTPRGLAGALGAHGRLRRHRRERIDQAERQPARKIVTP
jgi:hypothetical protein